MMEPLFTAVLFNGTTISVIATDKHSRIVMETTTAKNPIIPIITRFGIESNEKSNEQLFLLIIGILTV